MKRLLLLSFIIIASVQIRASHLASELNLRMQNQSWFTLSIDNQVFEMPVNHFHTGGLEPGNHWLHVTRLDHGHYGPYTVPVTVFKGYIFIPALSRIHAIIDRHGKLRINHIIALAPVHHPVQPVHPGYYPVTIGMSDYEFDQLRNSIDRLNFESTKLQVAKQALSSHRVSSLQVTELVKMLTFESSKLELAKFAYHNTIDKQNYYLINDAFSFESSIHELNEFIFRS